MVGSILDFYKATPELVDETGIPIPGSTQPKPLPDVNELIKEPRNDELPNVAYRVLKLMGPSNLSGQTITWSMTPRFTPTGEADPRFLGAWPQDHPDRFEGVDVDTGDPYSFERVSQEEGRTTFDSARCGRNSHRCG